MSSPLFFSGKAYAQHKGRALPLFDEITVHKTERKKIQIEISGPFSKGIPNNQSHFLYQFLRNFFLAHGFSFGVEISLTKNIPPLARLHEEISAVQFVTEVLWQCSHKSKQYSKYDFFQKFFPEISTLFPQKSSIEKNTIADVEVILFPQYGVSEDFLMQVVAYQGIDESEFFLSSFFDIQKKIYALENDKKNQEISDFGFINNGPSLWVRR